MIRKFCGCGTLVYECPHPLQLPATTHMTGRGRGRRVVYGETVICPKCGKDNSRQAMPWDLLPVWKYLLLRRFRHWRAKRTQAIREWYWSIRWRRARNSEP